MLAHCSPSSEWVPGYNIGEIKAARKGPGYSTPYANGSGKVTSLAGTPLHTKVYGNTFTYTCHINRCLFFTPFQEFGMRLKYSDSIGSQHYRILLFTPT